MVPSHSLINLLRSQSRWSGKWFITFPPTSETLLWCVSCHEMTYWLFSDLGIQFFGIIHFEIKAALLAIDLISRGAEVLLDLLSEKVAGRMRAWLQPWEKIHFKCFLLNGKRTWDPSWILWKQDGFVQIFADYRHNENGYVSECGFKFVTSKCVCGALSVTVWRDVIQGNWSICTQIRGHGLQAGWNIYDLHFHIHFPL